MATIARQVRSETEAPPSRERALCTIFDIVEDSLEKMGPEERKAWISGLSETVEKLEKQA
jgi:hypothetical protein